MHRNNIEFRRIYILLAPSWLSGFVIVSFSLLLQGIAIVSTALPHAAWQSEIGAINTSTYGPSATYDNVVNSLSRYSFFESLPLLIFWAGIGLIVYLSALRIAHIFGEAYANEKVLHYTNVNRGRLLLEALMHTIFRLIALISLILIVNFLIHYVLPHALLAAHQVGRYTSPNNIIDVALATLGLIITLNLAVTCIRLLFLRPRLFSEVQIEHHN